jgi:hypothetical protein
VSPFEVGREYGKQFFELQDCFLQYEMQSAFRDALCGRRANEPLSLHGARVRRQRISPNPA